MATQTLRPFDPWRVPPLHEDNRKELLSGYYFDVDCVSMTSPDAGSFARKVLRMKRGDTVAVLAVTDDGRIPLVEQYRVPTHRWTLEVPAGHAKEDGETTHDVAVRKLRQEAGVEAGSIHQAMRFINTPSYSDHQTSIFIATDLKTVPRQTEGPETERSSVRWYTLKEAHDLVLAGTIVDAKSIIAILRAWEEWQAGSLLR